MYLKNIAAAGLSALLLFSGAVSAGAAETVSDVHDDAAYAAAVETLASNGLAAASATSLQAADGLQLAREAGLLDDGSGELSLTELTAQALLRETEALQKQNFLETYDGVLVSCDGYISLRKEPSTDAARCWRPAMYTVPPPSTSYRWWAGCWISLYSRWGKSTP